MGNRYVKTNPFRIERGKLIPLTLLDTLENSKVDMYDWKEIEKMYANEHLINETLRNYYIEKYYDARYITMDTIQLISLNIKLIHNWAVYKQVYKFDTEWFMYLCNEFKESRKLHLEVLYDKLPFHSFFIDNSIKLDKFIFNGIFVDIGYETTYPWGTEYPTLTACFVVDNEEFTTSWTSIPLIPNMSVNEIFDLLNDKYNYLTENTNEHNILTSVALSLLFYLCADNKDIEIRQGKTPKDAYELKKTAKKGVKQESIGVRLGNTIRENKVRYVYESNEHNKGSKKSPHIRGGHYHHFWTGKKDGSEERKLIMHYIEPIFIGGNVDKVTIHRVKE